MSAFSDYMENKILDLVFQGTAFSAPTPWLGLHTADPGDASFTNEVSGGSYARQQLGTGGVTFSVASGGTTDNDAAITFPTATANWGTVTHITLADASTAGNQLFNGALTASKTVNDGDVFRFQAGELDITLQ